jgi:hypothetical protein
MAGRTTLPVSQLNQTACPANTLTDSCRLYSPAMVRFTVLINVKIGLPSF